MSARLLFVGRISVLTTVGSIGAHSGRGLSHRIFKLVSERFYRIEGDAGLSLDVIKADPTMTPACNLQFGRTGMEVIVDLC